MKNIIITGALGHIGSKLIRELPCNIEANITMIDNLLTQRYTSLFNLPKANFTFIQKDILQIDLEKYFKDADVVIHLAAITDAASSFDKSEEVEKVNYIGTKKVADACFKTQTKLIFLSTTSVYGTQKEVVDENCSKDELKPQSPYAISKLKSEEMLKSMNLEYVILRFGTIFGFSPGIRFHTAVNKFCFQAVMGESLSVWKTAYHQKRPYLDLEDAVNSIVFIIKNDIFNQEIYNVLTLNATVEQIVETIRKNINDIKINFVKHQIMNQLSYDVSPEKLKKLGFKYNGNLDNSIKQTIDILKNSNSFQGNL